MTLAVALQDGVVYGPVASRRYGCSLGINLMPTKYRLCPFSCVYCHLGDRKKHTLDVWRQTDDLPALSDVVGAVDEAVRSPDLDFDQITISGNGEPTLYPGFPQMVDAVVSLRDRYRPGTPIGLLSNGCGLRRKDVRDAVSRIDLPVFKLDVGTEEQFHRINRPVKGVDFSDLIDALASVDNVHLQTVVFDGDPSNSTPDELDAYCQLVERIQPRQIHLYSIERPVPRDHLTLVPTERLEHISDEIFRTTRIPALYNAGN